MVVPTNWEILVRLIAITGISGLIGIEREYHAKPAGLRTNVMVGLASTIMTIAGIRALELYAGAPVDPTRIAGQIVTGVGFIGAGAILRPGKSNVVGLTTAATLFVVSGLGIAVGMGLYAEALLTTGLVFFTFLVLGRMVSFVRRHSKMYPTEQAAFEHDEDVLRHSDVKDNGHEATHER
jgi:putative Mg2+ transporter-C (MgtC) family protein